MLIKFFARGQGKGSGPVEYVTKEQGRENSPPEVLRGDPQQTTDLINSIDREWRYTSGVISFAEEDAPSESDLEQVMTEFEQTAFAGLEREQYDILWVKHSHTGNGRAELHFVSPRMELRTGKALNIAPPGWEATFRPLREALNAEKGWADPDDPKRARALQRAPEGTERLNSREKISEYLQERIAAGQVQNRAALVQALQEVGMEVPRQGKDYVTALDPESGEKWRLKGEIYRKDWTYDGQLERAAASQDRARQASAGRSQGLTGADQQGPDAEARQRAARARADLSERVRKRAEFHRERYREAEGRDNPERRQEPECSSDGPGGPAEQVQRGEPATAQERERLDAWRSGRLSTDRPERFRLELDRVQLEQIRVGIHDSRKERPNRPDRSAEARTGRAERDRAASAQRPLGGLPEPFERQGPARTSGVHDHKSEYRPETADRENQGLSHDRTGKAALGRVEKIGNALQRSARAITGRAGTIQSWLGRIDAKIRDRFERTGAGTQERADSYASRFRKLVEDHRGIQEPRAENQLLDQSSRDLGRGLAALNRTLRNLEPLTDEFARSVRPDRGRAGPLPEALARGAREVQQRQERQQAWSQSRGRDFGPSL